MMVDTTHQGIVFSHPEEDEAPPVSSSTTTTTVNRQAHPVMLPPSDPSLIEYDDSDGDNNSNHNNNTARRIIRSVPAKMNYVSQDTTQVHVRRDLTGDDHGTEFNEGAQGWIPTDVCMRNGRLQHDQNLCLETHGFELQTKPLVVSSSAALDFLDSTQVLDTYYPSCENILMEYFQQLVEGNENNGKRPTPKLAVVKAFDHNIRIRQGQSTTLKGYTNNDDDDDDDGTTAAKTQPPLGMVHGDYTIDSGPRRIRDLGQPPKANDVWKERLDAGEAVLNPQLVQDALEGKRRFAIINVWRNIDTEFSVEEYPLACVDSTTVNALEELRRLYIHYADRVGENYFVTPSSLHQWYYFPHMTHSEILLIKQWDSHGDMAAEAAARNTSATGDSHPHPHPCDHNKEHRSTFSIHSAFVDPTSANITNKDGEIVPPKPRKSIEVRCALIWERDEEDVPE